MQGIKIKDKIINLNKVVYMELSSKWIRFNYEDDSLLITFDNEEESKDMFAKIEEICCKKGMKRFLDDKEVESLKELIETIVNQTNKITDEEKEEEDDDKD